MAQKVLIIGKSGTGKSTSIRTLDSKETFIIQVVNKELPFRGARKNYTLRTKENQSGNRIVTSEYSQIVKVLKTLEQDEKIKTIIIDDISYLMSKHFFNSTVTGYSKFDDIAKQFEIFINSVENLKRDDLFIFLMGHQEEDSQGNTKFKTVGKMVDNYLNVEGLFTIVLNTVNDDNGYHFATQNNGYNTSKSPVGMFESKLIDNDLNYVKNKIIEYYESEE